MKSIRIFLMIWAVSYGAFAQDTQNRLEDYSLEQCIEYALKNSLQLANAKLDIEAAQAQIKQTRADGLPQINANFAMVDNFQIPKAFLPAQLVDPTAPAGTFVPVSFQPRFSGTTGINLQQLIFDGSYFVALKAAQTYGQVPQHAYKITKNELIANVSKSYYAVLVNEERLQLIDNNLNRLESLYNETKAMYDNGLVEKLDVDRLEVALNNFKTEKQKLVRIAELTMALLKYQIGLNTQDFLSLSQKLRDIPLEMPALPEKIDHSQRPEFLLSQTQIELDKLQIKNFKSGYYPKLYLSIGYGANTGVNEFSKFVNFSDYWFSNGNYALSLSVPIFDGFRRKYMIQKQYTSLLKSENSLKDLRRSIDLQVGQAAIILTNSLESLEAQKKNMELAKEVYRVAQVKYKEGLGSNLEIVNAESSYKEAETNYFSALYDALVAKVDLEKAQGLIGK